ncbi:outer membrane protein TolC [Wenyingzhuangia heitensis]|uniref:Outer membrane protein TolC n=1 Tax=Wenyingzhuangia heitensis TaxID=1487859 RepID=A0ABX0U9W8_9FLAO|nr:TolC family protein [Wenyingzhuangia heitensis]NIJ44750.1 outer membrane protein TolC [Wenyingzhuangia heitensis]
MSKLISLLILLLSISGFSQTTEPLLSYKEYIFNIINEHPIAKSALLKEKIAKAKLLTAKGGFDPSLISSIDQKQFKDKEYYTIFKNKITIPTPIGVNITGGFDNNSGYYLNPENKTTGSGLWSAGLEVDVLQGLLTNTRRTALKQAKVYQQIAKNQQQQLLNELIFTASIAYAEWQQYASIYKIMEQNLQLSQRYLNNTKTALQNGEKTTIDTLEANVYLQNSKIDLIKYQQLLTEKKLKVENNLWLDNRPIGLKNNIEPELQTIATENNQIKLTNNLDSIPLIAEKVGKKEVLLLKQKLNREKLKPKLKLKYNQLLSTTNSNLNPNFDVDNYKWAASLTVPLLFRSERGKYRESKYKIEEINYEIAYKRTEVQNKIVANQQNQIALSRQINLLEQNIKGYKRLLDAESTKFNYGESSMFLINKRQEKLIESELKLLSSQNKLITNYLDYLLQTNNIIPND